MKKYHLFLAGLNHFTVITDHNPQISILNSHRLDEIENHVYRVCEPDSWGTSSLLSGSRVPTMKQRMHSLVTHTSNLPMVMTLQSMRLTPTTSKQPFTEHPQLSNCAHQPYHQQKREIFNSRSSGNMQTRTRTMKPLSLSLLRDSPTRSPRCLTH